MIIFKKKWMAENIKNKAFRERQHPSAPRSVNE